MSEFMDQILLALGSNLGDRMANLRAAVDAVGALQRTWIKRVSHAYESAPWGVADQPAFLNAACVVVSEYPPLLFLRELKEIERRLGRAPGGAKWGPRVIDIDIVLWGDVQMSGPELTLPHPEFRRRAFVLAPLAEIAGAAVDPVTGLRVAELAGRPEVEGTAIKGEPLLPTDLHR
jgi:2-amino-4-hydroxy-6-hydroxymethyldihydropteridine diphosphokinase